MLHRVSAQEGFNLYSSVDREAFTFTVEAHPNAMYESNRREIFSSNAYVELFLLQS